MTETATTTTVPVVDRDRFLIGGRWVEPTGRGRIEVIGAATEEVIGSVPEGTAEDVDRAVRAARAALPGWSATSPAERAEVLSRLQHGLAARTEEIATTIAAEVGMPLRLATVVQAGLPVFVAQSYAELLRSYAFEERLGNSLVVRDPVGVVAAITPWNYPLHQIVAKLAAALAAGCTVVVKPSEVAPLSAFILGEVVVDAAVPPGVVNIVTGTGPTVGEALVLHPDVAMVSLTGSTRAGRRVFELASRSIKRLSLELGGKSASLVLDNADLERAVGATVSSCLLNSGQTCNALTRLLVPRRQQDAAVDVAVAAVRRLPLGDPFAEASRLGPLASAAQRDRVRGYIERGIAEGARLVCGGPQPPAGFPRGYYVQPTIFAEVRPEMTIAQEEIFGPVLSIIPYDTEDQAIDIANGTIYGLAAAVWSGSTERATAVARRLAAGQVEVNGGGFNPLAPFGGFKQSGLGRELGRFGLEEYLEIKSLQLPG